MIECLRMIKKNITTCIAMITVVILVGCLIILLDSKIQEQKKEHDYLSSGKYKVTIDALGPDYSSYLRNGNGFSAYVDLYEKLNNNPSWKFISKNELYAPIIRGTIPDVCYKASREKSGGIYDNYVRVVIASDKFISENDIRITGELEELGSIEYGKKQSYPILAGSYYEESLTINDTLEIDIDGIAYECYVAGFVKADSVFYSEINDDFVSCNDFIFFPQFYNMENNRDCRDLLERYFSGVIYANLSYEDVKSEIDAMQSEYNINSLQIIDSDTTRRYEEWNSRHSKMSGQIADSLERVVWALILGTAGVLGLLLTTVVRREMYNFGIYMLCGRTYKYIVCIMILFVLLILGISDIVLIIMCLLNESMSAAYVKVQIMLLMLMAMSISGNILIFKKSNIVYLMGGKE